MHWASTVVALFVFGAEHRLALIDRLEAAASDAYVHADQSKWLLVTGDVAEFKSVWDAYRKRALHMDPSLERHINAASRYLATTASSEDVLATRRAANLLSHLLAPMVDDAKVWPGLAELKPLEREVALSATEGAWGRALNNARATRRVFLELPCGRKLRPQLRRALDQQEAAVDRKNLASLEKAAAELEDAALRLQRACAHWRPPTLPPAGADVNP